MKQDFAEEFTLGGVNQGMRGEDLLEVRERSPCPLEMSATGQSILGMGEFRLHLPERATGKLARLVSHLGDEGPALFERRFGGGVVRLPKSVIERLREMHAFTQQHYRLAAFQRHGDQSGPTGVWAKSDGGIFHFYGSLQVGETGSQECREVTAKSSRNCDRNIRLDGCVFTLLGT